MCLCLYKCRYTYIYKCIYIYILVYIHTRIFKHLQKRPRSTHIFHIFHIFQPKVSFPLHTHALRYTHTHTHTHAVLHTQQSAKTSNITDGHPIFNFYFSKTTFKYTQTLHDKHTRTHTNMKVITYTAMSEQFEYHRRPPSFFFYFFLIILDMSRAQH